MAVQGPIASASHKLVDARFVVVRDFSGNDFVGEELIKVRAKPMGVGILSCGTRRDEQFIRVIGSWLKLFADLMVKVAETSLQSAHDAWISPLPACVIRKGGQSWQVVAQGK